MDDATLKIVLDTNVVLDWLVFNRTEETPLQAALRDARIEVVTSAAALDELERVLAYPLLGLDAVRQAEVLQSYTARTVAGAVPEGFSREQPGTPPGFPRCKDRSDDHFLALAWHSGAQALVSKDKEVLKLRKRAAKFGVRIVDVPQCLAWLIGCNGPGAGVTPSDPPAPGARPAS